MKSNHPIVPLARTVLLAAGLLAAAGAGHAEPKGQDAAIQQVLRKAQGVVRQLTEEKAQLESQKAALETEKAALQNEKAALQADKAGLEERVKRLEAALRPLQPLPAELQRCKAGVQALQAARARLEAEIVEGRGRERGLQEKEQEAAAFAVQVREDNVLLVEAVKEREQWIAQCDQKNRDLRAAGRQVVEKYREKDFWEEAANLEPFTGIGKVQRENSAEEFRYRIEHLKATPFQGQVQPPQGGWDAAKATVPAPEQAPSAEPAAAEPGPAP